MRFDEDLWLILTCKSNPFPFSQPDMKSKHNSWQGIATTINLIDAFVAVPKLQLRLQSPATFRHSGSGNSGLSISNASSGNTGTIVKRFAAMDIGTTPKKRIRHFTHDPWERNRTVQVFATPQVTIPTILLGWVAQMRLY